MITADDLDLQLGQLLFGQPQFMKQKFGPQSRQYSRDSFAQGLLIERMEELGFRHESLPALPLFGTDGSELSGHRFVDGDGTAFESYAASAGVALVTAAHEAFTVRQQSPFPDEEGDSAQNDQLLDAVG